MAREVESTYGCFRCGTLRPPTTSDPDTEKLLCGVCGEPSVVTFKQALDMLNGYYVNHQKEILDLMDFDEYYFEEIAPDDDA